MDIGLTRNLKINQFRLIAATAETGQIRLAADALPLPGRLCSHDGYRAQFPEL
ncbi:hypothetical protein [Hahella sp. CCB-MM4]|uniref:hypothetical protein n=1 Tax=Hahella sp. (strain CCB-MM4) TaxID=1926491 RepID=UPI00143DF247|nr:hypothetical protein [Hahella sp. CCB-MM4]